MAQWTWHRYNFKAWSFNWVKVYVKYLFFEMFCVIWYCQGSRVKFKWLCFSNFKRLFLLYKMHDHPCLISRAIDRIMSCSRPKCLLPAFIECALESLLPIKTPEVRPGTNKIWIYENFLIMGHLNPHLSENWFVCLRALRFNGNSFKLSLTSSSPGGGNCFSLPRSFFLYPRGVFWVISVNKSWVVFTSDCREK